MLKKSIIFVCFISVSTFIFPLFRCISNPYMHHIQQPYALMRFLRVPASTIQSITNKHVSDPANNTVLHTACSEGDLKKIQLLIAEGANVNAVNKSLQTPLHYACQRNNVEVVKYLLKSGANIGCEDKYNRTPYDIACMHKNHDILFVLDAWQEA